MTRSFQHRSLDTFSYAGRFTTLTVDGVPATGLTGFTVSATIKTYPERGAVDTLTVTTGPGLAVYVRRRLVRLADTKAVH